MQQGSLIHQENVELCRSLNIMSQQKMELSRQVYFTTFSQKLEQMMAHFRNK
jgi:hypothetical protein